MAAGLIKPAPRKRPRSSYIRFQADLPNETWQSDFTHYRLASDTEIQPRFKSNETPEPGVRVFPMS